MYGSMPYPYPGCGFPPQPYPAPWAMPPWPGPTEDKLPKVTITATKNGVLVKLVREAGAGADDDDDDDDDEAVGTLSPSSFPGAKVEEEYCFTDLGDLAEFLEDVFPDLPFDGEYADDEPGEDEEDEPGEGAPEEEAGPCAQCEDPNLKGLHTCGRDDPLPA